MAKTNDPFAAPVLEHASARELLASYELILGELRKREVVRTNDAPSGQYAEWIGQRVLGGVLASNSVKSHDLLTEDNRRIQIKSRVLRNPTKFGTSERQLSPFRSFEFEEALVILFDISYRVARAVLLPAAVVLEHSTYRSHVNGHVAIARDSLMDLGKDITDMFNRIG